MEQDNSDKNAAYVGRGRSSNSPPFPSSEAEAIAGIPAPVPTTPILSRRGRPSFRPENPVSRNRGATGSPKSGTNSPEGSPCSPPRGASAFRPLRGGGKGPQVVRSFRNLNIREQSPDVEGPEVTRDVVKPPTPPSPVKVAKPAEKIGREIALLTNYFRIVKDEDWSLIKYSPTFDPPEEEKFIRKCIIKRLRDAIFVPYLYDGEYLFTPRVLSQHAEGNLSNDVTFISTRPEDGVSTNVTLSYLGRPDFKEPIYAHFYNLMTRKTLFGIGLEDFGKGFFDPKQCIDLPAVRIQLWPGYISSMKQHEKETLFCVEITHKVLRTETVLELIQGIEKTSRGSPENLVNDALANTIIITSYNNLSYRVIQVDYRQNPTNTFPTRKGGDISYMDYYSQKNIEIYNKRQPLILAQPMKKQFKKPADKNNEEPSIFLVPELCIVTGLTDSQRSNFSLMRELAKFLHMPPTERINAIKKFMARAMQNDVVINELAVWGLHFRSELLEVNGRVLPKQQIIFANKEVELPNDEMDWSKAFRGKKLLSCSRLSNWFIVAPKKDQPGVTNLVRTMQKVSTPLGFKIESPVEILYVGDGKSLTYIRAVDSLRADKCPNLQIAFIILPTNNPDVYGAIKKHLVVNLGVSSQCFLSKNVNSKGLMSICTKLVVQISAKLGAEPWTLNIPLKALMVIGYDIYGPSRCQVGAMVGSLTSNFTKYFSTVSSSIASNEMIKNMCKNIKKCILSYKANNGELPNRIIMYRGGIEGDASADSLEVASIKNAIMELYQSIGVEAPKFTYILVSKKINTKLFVPASNGKVENPPPGTVVDNEITTPDVEQFFVVSSTARQGTASPCSYIVAYDDGAIDIGKLQLLTYKLCHLYFNWSGTVAVPAPVQYARKLATLSAVAYEKCPPHSELSELLYYL